MNRILSPETTLAKLSVTLTCTSRSEPAGIPEASPLTFAMLTTVFGIIVISPLVIVIAELSILSARTVNDPAVVSLTWNSRLSAPPNSYGPALNPAVELPTADKVTLSPVATRLPY